MPNPILTDITVVLDRSGSMSSIRSATIEAYNKFLADQKKVPGECLMTLVQFDDQYQIDYAGIPIGDATYLSVETYVPRGDTRLLDAIGRTIDATGSRLASLREPDRPSKVVIAILTDGQENDSREYISKPNPAEPKVTIDRAERIRNMIELQSHIYQWKFVFLGANQDAVLVAGGYGIPASAAMTYNPLLVGCALDATSGLVEGFRRGEALAFTDEQRQRSTGK